MGREQDERRPLPGSARDPAPGVRIAGPVDPAAPVDVTVYLRRAPGGGMVADQADLDLVLRVLAEHGVDAVRAEPATRRLFVRAPAGILATLFGTELFAATSLDPGTGQEVQHRHRTGQLSLPGELAGVVTGVLGLDDRPQARTHFQRASTSTNPGYTPLQLATAYQFPADTDGTGQLIALIELGGGYLDSDLQTFFASLGLAVPQVSAVSVDGAANAPTGAPDGPDGEVSLDLQVAGAIAPKAKFVVYFAPNTDRGFVDAVTTAAHAQPTPVAISISWGGPENTWTAQARELLDTALADAASLGITATVAAGDSGSSDGEADGAAHVDFPASSPHALGCGGTRLELDAAGSPRSETVWNDGPGGGATGGGVSAVYPVPSWQAPVGLPSSAGSAGRGVPDVAGNADPLTGYRSVVDGTAQVVGGTSAVAPLWAALIARLAQTLGHPFGLLAPRLYAGVTAGQPAPGFTDITVGNNGAYSAGPGWDACTGLGSPVGTALARLLSGAG